MTVHLAGEIATAPHPVARFTINSNVLAGDPHSTTPHLEGLTLKAVSSRFDALRLVLELAATVANDASPSNPQFFFQPLQTAGWVVSFFSRALDWLVANEEIGVSMGVFGTASGRQQGAAEHPDSILRELNQQLSLYFHKQGVAKEAVLSVAAKLNVDPDSHSSHEWPLRLLSDLITDIEELEARIHRTLAEFQQFTTTKRDSSHLEYHLSRLTSEGTDVAARSVTTADRLPEIQLAAIRAFLDPAFGDSPPVARISYASPLEIVMVLGGSAGATIAVLNQLLDLHARLRNHDKKVLAEQLELEEQILASKKMLSAAKSVRAGFVDGREPIELSDVAVFPSIADEKRDRGSDRSASDSE